MLLLWFFPAFAAPVDRVLFVVGDRIVTQTDTAFETFFDEHDHGPIPRLADPATPVADRLRDIAVIRQIAGEVSVFRPTNADVRARADAFLATWPRPQDGLAALAAWGLDEPGFLGFVYSRLVVERCVARSVGLPPVEAAGGPAGGASGGGAGAGGGAAGTADWDLRYSTWVDLQRARVDVREPPREDE